jgi:hypothetical protein
MFASSSANLFAAVVVPTLSAQGRQLWIDIDDEEEAIILAGSAVASTSADTLTTSISRTTFRTTPVSVRELSNMGHKILMFNSLDTTARLRTLIFVKFGIPSASQRLLFRGVVVGDGDNTLFSAHLLGERLVHVTDLRVVEVCVRMPGALQFSSSSISPRRSWSPPCGAGFSQQRASTQQPFA